MEFKIKSKGHRNVSSMHKSTFEITKDLEIGPAADCIIGVDMDDSMLDFPEEFKNKIANFIMKNRFKFIKLVSRNVC